MKALITGASDGIGKHMAYILANSGHDVFVVARNHQKLYQNFKHLPNCKIISLDLSNQENCFKLYSALKNEKIDILINNAGIGTLGEFSKTSLTQELNMIDLNIKAVHILTKLFLKDMIKRNNGYILNVASIGGFLSGPMIASYYATKSYILNLTLAINQELRASNKYNNIYIGAFCPATVNTNFHKKAGANKKVIGTSSKKIANYAIKSMFKKRVIIIPGFAKIVPVLSKAIPRDILLKLVYKMQIKKV